MISRRSINMDLKATCFLLGLIVGEMCSLVDGKPGLIFEIQNARSVEDFLRYVRKNGQPVKLDDVLPNKSLTDDNGQPVYASEVKSAPLAKPDECSPRLTTVRIPRRPGDNNVVYWPSCTRVKRCGGCCVDSRFKCSPTRTQYVERGVLRATITRPGITHLEWDGKMPVILLEHLACEPACRVNRTFCHTNQVYDAEQCQCLCINRTACSPLHMWDDYTCTCKCSRLIYCGPSNVFNPKTCMCEIRRGFPIGVPTHQPTIGVPTHQPTTRERFDPCKKVKCPPHFLKRLSPSNPKLCVCTPLMFMDKK